MEKSDMHESLAKAESQVSQLEGEKKKLLDSIKKVSYLELSLHLPLVQTFSDRAVKMF